ncbi:hypothetical protein [Motilimonas cestriensis]|uniref:hypothetical protein n=1 Tax=Motilimonas cestriensis TaxID=2742685 RepID=UPI003DA3DFED
MKCLISFILIILYVPLLQGEEQPELTRFIMDYPHGEERILSNSDGAAYLYYGAHPRAQVIKKGTFSPLSLYHQFKAHLQENQPGEKRSDSNATYGMVTLVYSDGSTSSHLIFDVKSLAERVFREAHDNIVQ